MVISAQWLVLGGGAMNRGNRRITAEFLRTRLAGHTHFLTVTLRPTASTQNTFDRRLKLDIVLLKLFDKLLSDTDRCLKLPICIFEALVLMLSLLELLVFLVDFFLHLFAVVLSLTSF